MSWKAAQAHDITQWLYELCKWSKNEHMILQTEKRTWIISTAVAQPCNTLVEMLIARRNEGGPLEFLADEYLEGHMCVCV